MTKVAVDKRLLIGLAIVAGSALLGAAFLLGRGSNHSVSGPQASLPGQAPQTIQPQTGAWTAAPSGNPAPAPLGQAPGPGTVGLHGDAERAAVAAYFATLDRIQPGKMGDPDTAAQGIMESLSKGDASSFNAMIDKATSGRAQMASLAAPTPCVAFHRESLEVLDEGLTLMRGMKRLLEASSPGSAPDLTTQAQALKTRTEALQQKEKALRQRYGL